MSSVEFDPHIPPGTVLANRELAAIFKCSTQGGMRRSAQSPGFVRASGLWITLAMAFRTS
jgi:hypothetical protein